MEAETAAEWQDGALFDLRQGRFCPDQSRRECRSGRALNDLDEDLPSLVNRRKASVEREYQTLQCALTRGDPLAVSDVLVAAKRVW